MKELILCLLFMHCCQAIQVIYRNQSGYTAWIAGRNDSGAFMYCPTSCPSEEENRLRVIDTFFSNKGRSRCCANKALPFYHFYPYDRLTREYFLDVEYGDALGGAYFVYNKETNNSLDYFEKTKHNSGYLNAIPENKCQFPTILEMDLSDNRIKEIGNLTCLLYLSVLNLSHNKISFVQRGTFDDLYFLWKIDLSHNEISWIDQATLQSPFLQLKEIYFTSQKKIQDGGTLKKLNVSNLLPDRAFYYVDFSDNCIDEIINCDDGLSYPHCKGNWSIQTFVKTEDRKRGGRVYLKENPCFTHFPDIATLLNMGNDPSLLSSLYRYVFYWDNVIKCSSELYTVLYAIKDITKNGGIHIKCKDPESEAIYNVSYLFQNNKTEIFRTNLKDNSGCPNSCECYKEPSLKTVVVDCQSQGLNDTTTLPSSKQYQAMTVLLKNNTILLQNFTKKILQNVKKIDLSYNEINIIPDSFLRYLENATLIDLRGNRITSIPYVLRNIFLQKCVLKMDAVIHCSCSKLWLRDWLSNHECGNDVNITCENSGLNILHSPAFEDCEMTNWMLFLTFGLIGIPVLSIYLIYRFQIELYITYRRTTKFRKTPDINCKHDIYICCDENSLVLRKWLKSVFVPYFEAQRYFIMWPDRDFLPGSEIEEQVTSSVSKSANYVIFLSSAFCLKDQNADRKMDLEWRHIWNMYKNNHHKNILIVNYDYVRHRECSHKVVKGFLSLRFCFKFKKRLLKKIQNCIGPPLCQMKTFENKKPVFQS